jgi:hypothetical protein
MGLAAVVDFRADDGAVYYFVLLDTDEQFTLLISFAAAETWADYEDVIRAIFDTARIVDEE